MSTQYETLKEETHRFGKNSYLEVTRKRLVDGDTTTEFLLVTRGFIAEDGAKRWTRFVTIPDDAPTLAWLVDAMQRAATKV